MMIRVFFLLFMAVLSLKAAAAPAPATYSVGVASVDITPGYPIRLNGFGGRTKESEGVRQQIWAKALAVGTTDQDTVVVITVDTLGIPDDLTERVAAKLEARGIDRSRLAICASHTHSGPMIRNCANTLFGQPIADNEWQTILRYSDELEAKLEQVAVAALADRKPALLSWGMGKVDFAMNRRRQGGPVDHDLPLLAVRNPDGQLRAVFTNYACHCVTLSDDMISGDWAGYAMDHIQRRNPGCQALISIGCGADSNPRGGVLGSRSDVADSLGQELAEEVQRLLATDLRPLTAAPVSSITRVTLPLAPLPTREQWEEKAKNQNAIGHHARTQLARLDRGEALMTEISYPVQSVSFGDELAWVFLPGEVVVDYALRLKRDLDGGRVWVNAYSNACPGYVPSERILREGGYEAGGAMVYYDIPGPYATGLEETIVEAVTGQLKQKFPPLVDVAKTNGIRPLPPAEAVNSLRTKPGFHVELVASEPLIASPVAISFAPDGRLWVAEMIDYPQGNDSSGGQIRCLYDDNGDGRYDRSEVFVDGLPYPTGVTVWRNGVLICAAPDILYAEDTNGDGRADVVSKLFTGFATHNYQARVNSLEYGLDGWVYGSCGLFGGQITSIRTGEVIALGQRDFRFNPDTGVLEAATGSTQQGRVRNDWDDWFGCNNGTMLMHYPLADHYLRRNPYLAPSQTVVGIAAPPEPGRLFSISSQVLFMLSGPPNRPTAACGLGIYRDDLLGADYQGNAFTCEPVNNLVHRQLLSPSGVTFSSRRADDELDREFLASTDPWFRPVQAHTGLDGALWVVDMYRYVIEHPIWIPPDTLATLDPRAGSSMGRIYRVVPDGQPLRGMPRLDQLNGETLAAAMDSANGIQRDLVQQLIQWRHDLTAIPRLKELCLESKRPEVRVQAISTWANLETPSVDVLLRLLTDGDSRVRRHAVRISEPLLQESAGLAVAVTQLADDQDLFVRMQLASSSAFLTPSDAAITLAKLMAMDGDNVHMKSAIESSLTSENVAEVIHQARNQSVSADATNRLLFNAATLADKDSVKSIFAGLAGKVSTSPVAEHLGSLARFIQSWSRRTSPGIDPASAEIIAIWKPALDSAREVAVNQELSIQDRVAAVQLLAQGPFLGEPQAELLSTLLTPRTAPELQSAALAAMRNDGRASVAELVLADWETREPRLRKEGIALLLSRAVWTERLLGAIQGGKISSRELDLNQQQALLEHAQESIRAAAAKSLATRTSDSRQQVIDRYAAALNDKGDPATGRQVFQKHCSNCHRLQDIGHVVGPDIANYSGKPAQSLLIAVLAPNQAVDPRYQSYVVVLNDGRSVTGLIAEETASSLILLSAEGKRETVLRSEVDEIRGTGKSLMPEGFEQNATTEDMTHLWAFFRTLRLPPKKVEGNSPTIIEIPSEGNVALQASQAEIYGGDITFELPFQNIGYWHSKEDMVRWRIRSPAIREAAVWGEWACDPAAAGSSFQIEGAQPAIKGVTRSTGGWNQYQLVFLGTILVQEGESELIMRPGDNLRSALVDLRAIHLVRLGGVPLATGMVEKSEAKSAQPKTAAAIAEWLIDDKRSATEREALITESLSQAADIIPLMAKGLPDDSGSAEEYRRIPWIWRVAIAAGKSGDAAQIRNVLQTSLPTGEKRLEHWQAVVIGGGLINGISLSGGWPHDVLSQAVGEDDDLRNAWKRALDLSVVMADDNSVPAGTRYDALRMIALLDWTASGPQLQRYLQKGVNDELQMGAISGLSDVPDDDVAMRLIDHMAHFSEHNRRLAIDALARTESRRAITRRAISEGRLPEDLKKDERFQKQSSQ